MFCHSEFYITNYITLKRDKSTVSDDLDVKMQQLMKVVYISIIRGNTYLFCTLALHFYSKSRYKNGS